MARSFSEDVTRLTQELSWMLRAGIPLSRALDALAQEATSVMKPVLDGLRGDLRAGHAFSDALARHPRVFEPSFVQMVRVAEASGTLAEVLERLHAARKRMLRLRRKVVSTLVYPGFVTFVALTALVFVMTTVLPQIKNAIAMSDSNGAVVGLIAFSDFLVSWWQAVVLGVLVAVLLAVLALRQVGVRERLAVLPGIRWLTQSLLMAELSGTLSLLLSNGVMLADCFRLLAPVLGSRQAGRLILQMEKSLRRGEDFIGPVYGSLVMPPLFASLFRIGLETGRLDRSMEEAALIYSEKLETTLERFLLLIEPTIIVLVSLLVGLLVYTIFGALLTVNELVI